MDERELIAGAAREALVRHCTFETVRQAEVDGWAPELWRVLEEAGFPLLGIPESHGGAGGGLAEAGEVVRMAGRFAAPVPLAETALLGGWLLAGSGAPVPGGPLTVAPCTGVPSFTLRRGSLSWRLSGHARHVPWARFAGRVLVMACAGREMFIVPVEPASFAVKPGVNLAGEPRDDIEAPDLEVGSGELIEAHPGVDEAVVMARGALARAVQMAGALERVLELTASHAFQRLQFGRPLFKFQAIQQHLALMAAEVAAASAAVDGAIERAEVGDATAEAAMAKIRAGEAAGVVARLAHQIHGAIGHTREHQLQLFTRRLWSWREEYGSEADWSVRLGRMILAGGPDRAWELLTSPQSGSG